MASKKVNGNQDRNHKRGKGPEQMACNVCNLPHRTEECPLICAGVQVQDAELPSKAILTLPDTLMYKKLLDNSYEIISKYGFSKGTQFGPLDAPKSSLFNPKCSFVLKLFSGREYFCYLDVSDEANCNWMCLVPFTIDPSVKNCICYQLRDKIYFSVVNDIFPGQPLVVSYSPGYAAQLEASNKSNEGKQPGSSYRVPTFPTSTNSSENSIESDTGSQLMSKDYSCQDTTDLDADKLAPQVSGERKLKTKSSSSDFENISKQEIVDEDIDDSNANSKTGIFNSGLAAGTSKSSSESIGQKAQYSDKLNKRLGAVLAVDSWRCKFCREEKTTIADFSAHLIQHYKLVGAARTEKSRIGQNRSGNGEEIPVKEEPLENVTDGNAPTLPSFPYYCDICVNHKTFNRAEYLIRHLRKHTGEYYCNNCDQMFTGRELLTNHICRGNSESEDVKCTLCDKMFPSHQSVKNHLRLKHGKTYKCSKCQRTFTKASGLRKHACRRKTPSHADSDLSILHKCELCNTTFIRQKDLSKHLQTHKGLFTCNYCSKSLSNDSYKIHLAICETLYSMLLLQNTEEPLKCPQSNCTSVCLDMDAFRHHMTSHTHPFMCPRCNLRLRLNSDIKYHECTAFACDMDSCDKNFDILNDLRSHIVESHQEIKSYCYECALPFATEGGYNNHRSYCEENLTETPSRKRSEVPKKNESTGGSFVCETCGATYSKWSSLKTHKYTHGPKRFICDTCGKGFHRREMLDEHKFVHQDAQFPCDLCGKKMKSKKSLDVHSRIHSGVKRFHCEECGKTFAQKVNLMTHQYVHLKSQGFEGFPCPYCDKKFSSKEYLSFHIEGHEKGKTQHCDICDRSFVKPHMLRQHKKLTHSGCRFSCEFCDVVVRLNYSLMRHLKTRHIEYQEIWNRPGYSLERMIDSNSDCNVNGIQNIYNNSYVTAINFKKNSEESLMDGLNEDENSQNTSQNCDISVEEHIVEFSKDTGVVIPQTNMVFLRMDHEGEIVLSVTEEGQAEAMIEVEAEVIEED